MRHIKLLLLAATPVVVACNGIEDCADLQPSPSQQELQPVTFGAYVNRNSTRAGATGELTLTTLQNAAVGFGVFSYYTDGHLYSQMSLPNFMYNQQVTYDNGTSKWTYTPLKYWPNETGADTMSEDVDHVTFFAYAPHVNNDLNTGKVIEVIDPVTGKATPETDATTGIFGLSRAKDSGDPMVKYRVTYDPTKVVDLCWSTPVMDATKPAVGTTVNFNFKHALAALNVQIDADVDLAAHADPGNALDANTRIYVRSITFRGFAEKGQLNLNNDQNTPRWNNLDCDCDLTSQPITIYDGRRDGREGVAASLNETHIGLNSTIVQSGAYITPVFDATTPGVTNTPVNLFDVSAWPYADPADPTNEELAAALAAPIYVIPTNDPLEVTIVYDVETYDPKLVSQYLSDGMTHGSTIENSITAAIKTAGDVPVQMVAGKKYDIHLHLGMVSVKVNAEVTEWSDGGSAEIEVPKN